MRSRNYSKNDRCSTCDKQVLNGRSRCKKHRVITEGMRQALRIAHVKKMNNGTWGNQHGGFKGGDENHRMHMRNYSAQKASASGSHTLSEWEALKMKYRYMCLCCKRNEPEIRLTQDHIVPFSRGGNNDIGNIQPLCQSCNSRKSANIISYIPLSGIVTMRGENL